MNQIGISDKILRECLHESLKRDFFVSRTEEEIQDIIESVMSDPKRKQFHIETYTKGNQESFITDILSQRIS